MPYPRDDLILISLQRPDQLFSEIDGVAFPLSLVSVDGAAGDDEILQWVRLEGHDAAKPRLSADAIFTLRVTTTVVNEFEVVLPAANTLGSEAIVLDVEFETFN